VLATGVASIAVVGTAGYVTAMAFTALLVGAVLIAVGLFRLGWIAEFLSTPVIAGSSPHRRRDHRPADPRHPGNTRWYREHHRPLAPCRHRRGQVNGWSLLIALGVLTVIIAFQR